MELDVASFLTQAPKPAVFIVDCVWNMDASLIANNTVPLVHYIRRYGMLVGVARVGHRREVTVYIPCMVRLELGERGGDAERGGEGESRPLDPTR
jgi:hypothetical protein